MSIKKYETLLKTVDLGSLTRASEELGYTQSAISHTLTSLEEELGLRLLVRDRAGVRLTEDGTRLLPAIREICRANEELLRQISQLHGLEVGTIRIGTFRSVSYLPEWIAAFSQEHPNVNFELLQGSCFDIERWISEERVDFGFVQLPTGLKNLDCIPMLEEEFLAVFPAERPNVPEPFPQDELRNEAVILRQDTMEAGERSHLHKNGRRQRITYLEADDHTILAMVLRGLGMSILPELSLRDTRLPLQLRRLEPPLRCCIGIAAKSMPPRTAASAQFVSFVQKWVQDNNMKNIETEL